MKTSTLSLIAFAIFCVLCSSFISINSLETNGIIRHDTSLDEYRKIGNDAKFECVGRYSNSKESNDYATGVLVAPFWVLTAAHFVEGSSAWYFGGTYYKTQQIIRHPTKLNQLPIDRPAQFDGVDLAMIKLDRPVLNVKPAMIIEGQAEIGMIITKIGYGYLGDGIAGMKSPRVQERLGGFNTIDHIGGKINGIDLSPSVFVCDFDSPEIDASNLLGSPTPLEFEIGGSKGDSGGGVFVEVDGQWQLVGIVSGALNREIKYGSLMAFASVPGSRSWIEKIICAK